MKRFLILAAISLPLLKGSDGQNLVGESWSVKTMWAFLKTSEAQLSKNSYVYYGEIVTKGWLTGGEKDWIRFMNETLPALLPDRVTSMVMIHKGWEFENITECSNHTAVQTLLSSLRLFPAVTQEHSCNGSSWNFKSCRQGCVGICINCKNPCYSSCENKAVISPYQDHVCLPTNSSGVVQLIGFQYETPTSGGENKNEAASIDRLILLVVLSVLLVVVLGLSCVCFFIIIARRRNLKRQRRLDREAWKMENIMRRALNWGGDSSQSINEAKVANEANEANDHVGELNPSGRSLSDPYKPIPVVHEDNNNKLQQSLYEPIVDEEESSNQTPVNAEVSVEYAINSDHLIIDNHNHGNDDMPSREDDNSAIVVSMTFDDTAIEQGPLDQTIDGSMIELLEMDTDSLVTSSSVDFNDVLQESRHFLDNDESSSEID